MVIIITITNDANNNIQHEHKAVKVRGAGRVRLEARAGSRKSKGGSETWQSGTVDLQHRLATPLTLVDVRECGERCCRAWVEVLQSGW